MIASDKCARITETKHHTAGHVSHSSVKTNTSNSTVWRTAIRVKTVSVFEFVCLCLSFCCTSYHPPYS